MVKAKTLYNYTDKYGHLLYFTVILVLVLPLFVSDVHAAFYDFELDSLPGNFEIRNPSSYPGLIGTTTSKSHDGQKSLEISSPFNTSASGKGVTVPLSGNSGHISWWQYDAYGSSSPIYMEARLTTDGGDFFDLQLTDSGWGGERSGSYNIYINDTLKYGPPRMAGSWSKIDLYLSNNVLDVYINDLLVDSSTFVGSLVSLQFGIIGYSGGGYWIDSLQIDAAPQNRTLNLILNGTGSGFVSISPLSTSVNTPLTTVIPQETQVTLNPNPSEFSIFTGWGGDCAGQGSCTIVMDNDKTVYATFDDAPNPIRINGPPIKYFNTINGAYLGSLSGSEIFAWGISFSENLVLSIDKNIKITGGCNNSYSECNDTTHLNGKLVVKNGSVRVKNIKVTGNNSNHQPVANAGVNKNTTVGIAIPLDGNLSFDADNDILTYNWMFKSKPNGSNSIITSPNFANPSFVADVAGDYVIQLVVNDGKINSPESLVTISAALPNQIPVANAGALQSVTTGINVMLDGSGSADADGDTLTYNWSFTSKPAGSTATLSDATVANPTFTPDVAGTYVIALILSDGKANSSPATVTITATTPSIQLSKIDTFWNRITILPLPYYPYSSPLNNTMTSVFSGRDYTDIATFTLTASGANFTITNLSASNSTNSVTPYFIGLAEGQTVTAGTSTTFSLVSPHTYWSTVSLCYSFQILETGDTFTYYVSLKTN